MDDDTIAKVIALAQAVAERAAEMPDDRCERFLVEKQGSYFADVTAAGVPRRYARNAAAQMDEFVRATVAMIRLRNTELGSG